MHDFHTLNVSLLFQSAAHSTWKDAAGMTVVKWREYIMTGSGVKGMPALHSFNFVVWCQLVRLLLSSQLLDAMTF